MRGLLAPFGAFLVLLHVSLSGRSLLLTLGLVGAVLLLSRAEGHVSWAKMVRIFSSPYLPFVLVAAIVAPFQEKTTDAFWLLSIPVSYVLARLLRFVVPAQHLAVGLGLLGFVLGAVFVLGQSQVGEAVPPLEDLSTYLHKNVFGWIVAFGLVMAPLLWALYANRARSHAVLGALFGAIGVLLFLTGSMTGFLGAGATLVVVALISLVRSVRKDDTLSGNWWTMAPLAFGGLMFLAFAVANFWGGSSNTGTSLVGRDASLTGRTGLWSCFIDGLAQGGTEVDAIRQDCTAGIHSNLHNSFLEAYSIGGVMLAAALLFGFGFAITQGVRALWRSSDSSSRNEALFALAIAILGFLIAMVESYIFSRHVYPSLLLFLAPTIFIAGRQPVTGTSRWLPTRIFGNK